MMTAQQHEVVGIGAPAVEPMAHMVGVEPALRRAAREPTAAVRASSARLSGAETVRRRRPSRRVRPDESLVRTSTELSHAWRRSRSSPERSSVPASSSASAWTTIVGTGREPPSARRIRASAALTGADVSPETSSAAASAARNRSPSSAGSRPERTTAPSASRYQVRRRPSSWRAASSTSASAAARRKARAMRSTWAAVPWRAEPDQIRLRVPGRHPAQGPNLGVAQLAPLEVRSHERQLGQAVGDAYPFPSGAGVEPALPIEPVGAGPAPPGLPRLEPIELGDQSQPPTRRRRQLARQPGDLRGERLASISRVAAVS